MKNSEGQETNRVSPTIVPLYCREFPVYGKGQGYGTEPGRTPELRSQSQESEPGNYSSQDRVSGRKTLHRERTLDLHSVPSPCVPAKSWSAHALTEIF